MLDSPVCSPMRSRRPSSLSACSSTVSGILASSILARYSSTTEASSSPSSLRMDSICLRRKYSRCCFSAPSCTSSRREAALDRGAVFARRFARAPVDRHLVAPLVDLDAQLAAGAGLGGAYQCAVLAGDGHGVAAAGQADALRDLGHGTDLEELVVV